MQEQVDDFTGVSSKVIIESKDPESAAERSRFIETERVRARSESRSLLPVGAYLTVNRGRRGRGGARRCQDPA